MEEPKDGSHQNASRYAGTRAVMDGDCEQKQQSEPDNEREPIRCEQCAAECGKPHTAAELSKERPAMTDDRTGGSQRNDVRRDTIPPHSESKIGWQKSFGNIKDQHQRT